MYFSKIKLLAIGSIAATLTACAPVPRSYYSSGNQYPTQQSTVHSYTLTAVDASETPISNVDVDIEFKDKSGETKNLKCLTDADGKCGTVAYRVNRNPEFKYVESYSSSFVATAQKEGYYKAKASEFSSDSVSRSKDVKLKLIKPTDYLSDSFNESKSNQEIKAKVLKFLEVIRLQSILVDSNVMLKGIDISEFKGKKYLQIKLNSSTSYNSLKLNKYDIGKNLFDDSIRKILNPLNENISLSKSYQGYDLIIYGYTKSFAEKYETPKKIEYRFILPAQAVRRYKDKEISGQALLDSSVQLMDDERIELKLQ